VNIGDSEDVNRAWKNIKENIKISGKDSLFLFQSSTINHALTKNI